MTFYQKKLLISGTIITVLGIDVLVSFFKSLKKEGK